MDWKITGLLLWPFFMISLALDPLPPPCDSKVYCLSGENSLLHVVQMARLYKDSKTFVDKPIKTSEEEVLANFAELMQTTFNSPSKEQVAQFVQDNFDPEGSEFEEWTPSDWKQDIALFDHIQDEKYLDFAKDLHTRWQDLGRQIDPKVRENASKYSLHYIDKPFVVPGGRFREMYYWDSYWTIQGLIVSEMFDTVKGMLENFSQLIREVGHIPNGNRIYFYRRTQPPFYISMVDAYFEATDDEEFLQENIQYLDKEFQYWMENRTMDLEVNGKTHKLAGYNVQVDDPRPESYYEDFNEAQKLPSKEAQQEFYQNMKSGAESGWDYSTRWFFKANGSPSEDLLDIQTRHIIPVDLNSYLCKNAKLLSKFYTILGQDEQAQKYQQVFDTFVTSMDEVLWNSDHGAWFDFHTKTMQQNPQFYPSNLAPLWADCYSQTKLKEKIRPVLAYIEDQAGFDYIGGIPTSMVRSGQQWDFSNAWAPLQEIIVTGLENTGDAKALEVAKDLVSKWVQNVYVSYEQSGQKMFEKYDVEQVGLAGGGGEYDVQEGFGWSNGVIMHFLSKHGHSLVSKGCSNAKSSGSLVISLLIMKVVFY